MGEHSRIGIVSSRSSKTASFKSNTRFYLGIDVGSTSSDIVLTDSHYEILYSDYRRTHGRPVETVAEQLSQVLAHTPESQIELTAATGNAGRFIAKLLDIPFVNEVPAQAAAIGHLYPQYRRSSVIDMGGQDSKLIFLHTDQQRLVIRDFALNTACAAGTGSFLDQQAQRLGIDIEDEFGKLALQSTSVPRMAGRCSVFAKSDMIHLQQQATPTRDIIAGLCLALARNLKSNLGCGREFVKPIIFTGGVAANIGVTWALQEVFELADGDLIVPDEHFFTGALGAIITAKQRQSKNGQLKTQKLHNYLRQIGSALAKAPRRDPLSEPSFAVPVSKVHEELLGADEPVNAYLGLDVGSISTNVVVADEKMRVLAKAYLMTAGEPLEAVKRGLRIVGDKVAGKVNILGAATTGSGRYLTGDFVGADIVINEITAQATGAAIVNPQVDTIFEIGGQDSKYIALENGVVVDFEMNHACAAGTGSFLEEQAQRLEISINDEFAELALQSESPIKLGERCTVFMESDLLSYQQQGAQVSDLVAGLSYSIVANYLNRVVGRRRIGKNICFQGGTAYNKAVWAAFEKTTGKRIMVPDHHEVTGALGAAAIAARKMNSLKESQGTPPASKFRGFDSITEIEYSVESFTCDHCPNNCEIKKVQLPGSEPLYYGSRCDRYNLRKKEKRQQGFDAFAYRDKLLFEQLNENQKRSAENCPTVAMPMSLINWQMLPFFTALFDSLGFAVVTSGKTNKSTIRRGVEAVTAQTCFPVKVAYGHIEELLETDVDHIFVPSIVSMPVEYPTNPHNQLCPYVQSLPYQAATAFKDHPNSGKFLTVPLRLGEDRKVMVKNFLQLAKKLGVAGAAMKQAVEKAFEAQERFARGLREKGSEILDSVGDNDRLFVLISRPYNGCDHGLNLQLIKKLTEFGIKVIPMDMLDFAQATLTDEDLHKETYWSYGQNILRAAEIIKRDDRLFAIYLSNFSCGPDSFLLTFFKDIMGQKPCLQLEFDEHSADAGIITRIEAFLESLRHYGPDSRKIAQRTGPAVAGKAGKGKRKLYIPYMSDCSYGLAACFRSYGQPAEVIPLATEKTLNEGRKYTSGKECLPCAITTGDMLSILEKENPEEVAFFMPSSSGPCRFGMYNCLHKLVLGYANKTGVRIISPNQDSAFYQELVRSAAGANPVKFKKDLWASAGGIDLLAKVLLKLRPFAKDRLKMQQVYEQCMKQWIASVDRRTSFAEKIELMDALAEEMASVEIDLTIRKPWVGVVGEIYVRSHPFANMDIIRKLEQLGAVCELASLTEWIYYTNFTRKWMARRRGQYRNLLANVIQDRLQKRIELAMAEPLERRFGAVAEHPIEHVLGLASDYLHPSFEGEAILSVGKMLELHEKGVGGVVNVMPFSCMPSTIVSTQTMLVSEQCGNMPILNITFDGQEDPTFTTRLEAFVEQIRQQGRLTAAVAQTVS